MLADWKDYKGAAHNNQLAGGRGTRVSPALSSLELALPILLYEGQGSIPANLYLCIICLGSLPLNFAVS